MREGLTATALAVMILLAGCGKSANDAAPGSAGKTVFTDAMRASPGFRLAERYCSQCHAAPDPQAHNAAEWPSVVARMLENMRRQGRPAPSLQQTGTIVDYLQQFARKQ